MKKVLCYIALFFLISLIIIPPLSRILFKEEKPVEEVKDKIELLTCNKGNFTISTSYKNSVPLNIKFEHLKDEPRFLEEQIDYNLEYYLYDGLSKLTYARKEERINDKGETLINYYIVYTDSSESDLVYLSDYRYPVTEQKSIYEKVGYTCNIMG